MRVTTEKLAKTQALSSKFFCSKCFTGLLIPLANNQRVHFEEEESLQNYFEQKCVWKLAILDALQYASYFL